MLFQGSAPQQITESTSQPRAGDLSRDELRNCFPGAVSISNKGESIDLPEVPLLGLAVQLVEATRALRGGASAYEVEDVYGAYTLRFERRGDEEVELIDRDSGTSLRCPLSELRSSVATWSSRLLGDVEVRFPSLGSSDAFNSLRAYVQSL